jgi:hypothetical protein
MNQAVAVRDFVETASEFEEAASQLAGASRKTSGSEQIEVTRGEVSLCLIVNRRTRSMRVIDFRSGAQAGKFDLIRELSAREGIDRAYTVLEREESNTWAKMGFQKEGSVPGFYKRSDGYLLGMEMESPEPRQSGTRIKIQTAVASESDRAERAYQAARRLVRNRAPEALPRVKVAEARPQDIEKAFSHAEKMNRVLTGHEDFGRDVEKSQVLCTARGGFSLLVGIEAQPCFDNAFIEPLCAPRGDKETWLTAAALKQIGEELLEKGIVSAFSTTPAESVELNAAMVTAGFRRTGRLPLHLMVRGERTDAFLWSRRLCEV